MAIPGTNVESPIDTSQLKRKLSEMAITTSSLRIPFFATHQQKAGKGEVSNPHEWPQRALSKSQVELAVAFTPSSNKMVVKTGTTKAPVLLFEGNSEIGTYDGKYLIRVVTKKVVGSNIEITFKVVFGSISADITAGTKLALTSYTQHGQDMQGHNDGQKYSYDYNYISNKTLTYQVSNLLQKGYLASYKNKDYTIEDKKEMANLRQLLELEYDVLKSPRIAGSQTSTARTAGSEVTEDGETRMGGFAYFLEQGDAYISDEGGRPINLSMFLRIARYLDEQGAFDDFGSVSPNDSSTPLVNIFCDRNLKFDVYKMMLQVATGGVIAGDNKFGYSNDIIHVGGVDFKMYISNGMGPNEMIAEGRPDLNKILMVRENETTANTEGVLGDNEKEEEATTFTGKFCAPWLNAHFKNIGTLLGSN